MNKHQKGLAPTIVILIVLVIVCVGGILAWRRGWIPKSFVAMQTPTSTPTLGETADWKTSAPTDTGATFKYPENLPASPAGGSTNYIRPQEWPPKLLIIDNAGFSCEEGGLGINGRPGMTIQKSMNNTVYCIDSVSGGAAGTFYTDYTYTFLKDGKLVKLTFTLAYPQCENYDDPQKTECEQERQTFDLDVLIGRIAESVRL
jgi:hypothetical protein